ncbi:MAG: zinc ribbon domain-containing protein [Acidobacteriota bacterium]
MSLIYCPECGHEVSAAAVACPSCGRPLSARPVIEHTPVITEVRRDEGVPNWIFIPLGIIGALLLVIFFVVMSRNNEDANSNLSVNVNSRRPAATTTDRTSTTTTDIPPSSSTTVTAPPMTDTQTVTVPGSQTSVATAAPTKGSVIIDAKVSGRTGSPQPVKNEKFYLLDKDLETILSEAQLEPIEGQSLTNSLGLSVLYPDRFSEFNRNALRAIKGHIKYAGTTDGSGKAELGGIEPNSYYLFGVTRSGRGFAIWSSPVGINAGQNALNLTPQPLTEMEIAPGE